MGQSASTIVHYKQMRSKATQQDVDLRAIAEHIEQHPDLLLRHQVFKDTLWHVAARSGNLALLQQLCNHVKQRSKEMMACSAIKSHFHGIEHHLLEYLLDQHNHKGQTPLMLAAGGGHGTIVKLLLQEGASPWKSDRCGARTALHYAALCGSAECVTILLENIKPEHRVVNGIRYINTRSVSGFTALHYAMVTGNPDVVCALLAHEPDVMVRNGAFSWEYMMETDINSTALHLAARHGHMAAAVEILKYYAERADARSMPDPRYIQDSSGKYAYQLAAGRKHLELAFILSPNTRISTLFEPSSLHPVGVPSLMTLAAQATRSALLASVQAVKEQCATADVSSSSSSTCQPVQQQEEDDAYEVCGICLDEAGSVSAVGCGHTLCAGCAERMCQQIVNKPLHCAFCRGVVRGFAPALVLGTNQ